jgi:hypothetical protein
MIGVQPPFATHYKFKFPILPKFPRATMLPIPINIVKQALKDCPIPGDKLGFTLMHEHVVFAYPGWFADESAAPHNRKAMEAKILKF